MMNTEIVQLYALFHLLLSDMRSDRYLLNRCEISSDFQQVVWVFKSDSTNIGPIANLTAGGERAAKSAQCTY